MSKIESCGNIKENPSVFDNLIPNYNQVTFSLEEASAYLKIPAKTTLYYAKRKGELSYIPLGKGKLVFRKADLDEFLEKKLRRGLI
jgi:excisionase family DNA binding protein